MTYEQMTMSTYAENPSLKTFIGEYCLTGQIPSVYGTTCEKWYVYILGTAIHHPNTPMPDTLNAGAYKELIEYDELPSRLQIINSIDTQFPHEVRKLVRK